MSALEAFLEEVSAVPQVAASLGDPNSPEAKHFAGMQELFELLETSDSPLAIDLFDPVCDVVNRRQYPVRIRLRALSRFLALHNPGPVRQ